MHVEDEVKEILKKNPECFSCKLISYALFSSITVLSIVRRNKIGLPAVLFAGFGTYGLITLSIRDLTKYIEKEE